MTTDNVRWQGLFHRSAEPLFLLNRQRRLLGVNRAWEEWTGHPAAALVPEEQIPLRDRRVGHYRLDQLPSQMPALRRVADQVRLASQTRVPLVLLGEPGTGKQWVARTIHYQSAARETAFVPVD